MPLYQSRPPRHFGGLVESALHAARIDFKPRHRQPPATALVIATAFALLGSLLADVILVTIAKVVFSSTKHYSHFQFADYSKLTVIGVLIACGAWPFVTRITSVPRWLFFRAAVLVSAVLILPDIYILAAGQPVGGVFVLVLMHLAIAVMTYGALVHLAPARPLRRRPS
jgi:hypothetical protein